MRRISALAVALCFCAAAATAQPAEYHWRVKSYIDGAVKLCKEHGGTPGTPDYDKLVRLIDVNNDGKDDYVVDYRHFPCTGGAPNIFCVDGFCSVDFLSWRSENEWKGFLLASVADWRVVGGKQPALLVIQRDVPFCKKPHLARCTIVYTFRNGKMYGASREPRYFETAK